MGNLISNNVLQDDNSEITVYYSVNDAGMVDRIETEGIVDTLVLGDNFYGFADDIKIVDKNTGKPYSINNFKYEYGFSLKNDDGDLILPEGIIPKDSTDGSEIKIISEGNEFLFSNGKLKSITFIKNDKVVDLPVNCPEPAEDFKVLDDEGEEHLDCEKIKIPKDFSSFEDAKKYLPKELGLVCYVNGNSYTFSDEGEITHIHKYGEQHIEIPKDMPPVVHEEGEENFYFVKHYDKDGKLLPIRCEFSDGKISRIEAPGQIELLHLGDDFPGFTDDYEVIDTNTDEKYKIQHFEYSDYLKDLDKNRAFRIPDGIIPKDGSPVTFRYDLDMYEYSFSSGKLDKIITKSSMNVVNIPENVQEISENFHVQEAPAKVYNETEAGYTPYENLQQKDNCQLRFHVDYKSFDEAKLHQPKGFDVIVNVGESSATLYLLGADGTVKGIKLDSEGNYKLPKDLPTLSDNVIFVKASDNIEGNNAKTPNSIDFGEISDLGKLKESPLFKNKKARNYTATVNGVTYKVDQNMVLRSVDFKDKMGTLTMPEEISRVGQLFEVRVNGEKAKDKLTIKFPENTTKIKDSLFYDVETDYIGKIELPKGLKEIGIEAFKGNKAEISGLNELSTLEKIGKEAFSSHKGEPKSIDLSANTNLSSLGKAAFSWSGIKSIKLPDSLESVNWELCKCCENLENVQLGINTKSIASDAFNNCAKLKEVLLPPNAEKDGFSENTKVYQAATPEEYQNRNETLRKFMIADASVDAAQESLTKMTAAFEKLKFETHRGVPKKNSDEYQKLVNAVDAYRESAKQFQDKKDVGYQELGNKLDEIRKTSVEYMFAKIKQHAKGDYKKSLKAIGADDFATKESEVERYLATAGGKNIRSMFFTDEGAKRFDLASKLAIEVVNRQREEKGTLATLNKKMSQTKDQLKGSIKAVTNFAEMEKNLGVKKTQKNTSIKQRTVANIQTTNYKKK